MADIDLNEQAGAEKHRLFFRRTNRIQKRADFLKVYGEGTCVRGKLLHVFALRTAPDKPTRLGITATRKTGGSVVRNRGRRLVREAYRHLLPELPPGYDIVVNVMRAGTEAKMPAVQAALRAGLVKAGVLS